jgi:hypothetical protein
MPYPINPKQRYLLTNELGEKLSLSTWSSAWRRFTALAIKEGVITKEESFGLHDIKRRGTTDTEGTAEDKLAATGHKSRQMLEIYDKSIARVKTPK